MTKNYTSIQEVIQAIERAVQILNAMPEEKVRGYFNLWPKVDICEQASSDFSETLEQLDPRSKESSGRFYPFPWEIDEMEDVIFNWLHCLTFKEKKVLWKRCSGMGWKRVAYEMNLGERTAQRLFKAACGNIYNFLNLRKKIGENKGIKPSLVSWQEVQASSLKKKLLPNSLHIIKNKQNKILIKNKML